MSSHVNSFEEISHVKLKKRQKRPFDASLCIAKVMFLLEAPRGRRVKFSGELIINHVRVVRMVYSVCSKGHLISDRPGPPNRGKQGKFGQSFVWIRAIYGANLYACSFRCLGSRKCKKHRSKYKGMNVACHIHIFPTNIGVRVA